MQYPINLRLISALSLFALFTLPGESKETDEPFKVSKAGTSIQIDGKLDAAWKQTEVRTLDHYRRDEKADDRQKTKFRMLWDEENVYVFFECKDKYITARETERDGEPYFDDCAEIFLIPANEQLDMHYGFELNLYKASNDFIFLNRFQNGVHGLIKSYNPDFDVAVSIDGTLNDNSDTDTGWTMDMARPLKLFIGI